MKICLFKIPKNIIVFFCSTNNILVFLNHKNEKIAFSFKTKLILVDKNKILLTNVLLHKTDRNCIQNLWFLYFNSFKLILKYFLKQKLIKIKLNIIGIGYKFFILSLNNNFLIQIKAGFSHKIFYKLPDSVKVLMLKPTIIIIMGSCYQTVFSIVTSIKKLRLPEPYKKKGILYKNENIKIKQGKTC